MEATSDKFKYVNTKISVADIIKIIAAVVAIVGATTFFVYKMQDLPPRVDKLEQDLSTTRRELTLEVNNLKSQMDKNSTKTDIILEDVKIIKNHILVNHTK